MDCNQACNHFFLPPEPEIFKEQEEKKKEGSNTVNQLKSWKIPNWIMLIFEIATIHFWKLSVRIYFVNYKISLAVI